MWNTVVVEMNANKVAYLHQHCHTWCTLFTLLLLWLLSCLHSCLIIGLFSNIVSMCTMFGSLALVYLHGWVHAGAFGYCCSSVVYCFFFLHLFCYTLVWLCLIWKSYHTFVTLSPRQIFMFQCFLYMSFWLLFFGCPASTFFFPKWWQWWSFCSNI